MSFREQVAGLLFGDVIQQAAESAAKKALASVSVRVDDRAGWDALNQGPQDRPWADAYQDREAALEAWRKNFLVRRIVTLVRSYVVGGGISITSRDPDVDEFVKAFWAHPDNHMHTRLGPMCDELTRSGELFPVLFTKRADGMSVIRFVPSVAIREIETEEQDHETEILYRQIRRTTPEPKEWIGPGHRSAFKRARGGQGGRMVPLMMHFAVNRPVGAVRGEGDLTPILPWCKRYSEWLKDRVRLNRQRTRQGMMDIEIADDGMVQQKKQQLRTSNPLVSGIYVHGPGETVSMHSLEIKADDVKEDGRALRLAIACGANVGLHYLGEGESVNYATAKEMGEPTARFYTDRQNDFQSFLVDIVTAAWKRRQAALGRDVPAHPELQLVVSASEVARADNESLSKAAQAIVDALVQMKAQGWIDNATAARIAFQFAGEPLGEDEIQRILDRSEEQTEQEDPPDATE